MSLEGVNDILIACVDGLKGFPDAINTVYPQTQIQLCIVHMVRDSMKFIPSHVPVIIDSDIQQLRRLAIPMHHNH